MKITNGVDTKLVREAIRSGNLWGIGAKMEGVFHGEETPGEIVLEAARFLTMWERLEQSFAVLPRAEKEGLVKSGAISGDALRWPGFDANNEAQYLSAARFLIDHLERFQRFKGREFNSHVPTLDENQRMSAIFEPIFQEAPHENLSAAQISEVLSGKRASKRTPLRKPAGGDITGIQ